MTTQVRPEISIAASQKENTAMTAATVPSYAALAPLNHYAPLKIAEDTYISPGYVAHGIAWEWCRRGLLQPQIERLKKLYAPRLDACLASIDRHMPDAVATRPEGGFFISLTLPEGVSTAEVRKEAAGRGLNLADGLAFFPEGGGERFLRLPFCALTPQQIDEGIARLAASVQAVRHVGTA